MNTSQKWIIWRPDNSSSVTRSVETHWGLALARHKVSQLPLVDHQALSLSNGIPIRQIKNQILKPMASISSSLEADASGRVSGSSRCGRPLANAIPSWTTEQRRSWRFFWFPLLRDRPRAWDDSAFGTGSPLALLRFCSAERRNKTLEPCQFCPAPVFWLWQTAGSRSMQGVGHTGKNPHDVFSVAHRFSSEDFFFSCSARWDTTVWKKTCLLQLFGKKSTMVKYFPAQHNIRCCNAILSQCCRKQKLKTKIRKVQATQFGSGKWTLNLWISILSQSHLV